MTKEERREYCRKYYKKNKEKYQGLMKSYYQANKEKVKARTKANVASKKHEPVVYYLPEHHYVGITDCLYMRLNHHRSFYKRVTEGYEVIYNAKDMTEARAVERYMHYEMGYNGKKGGTKGY